MNNYMKLDKSLSSASNALLVLSILSTGDHYGYEITTLLKKSSNHVFALQEGTLYPLLHTLEKKEAVVSYNQLSSNGKPRKYYHITEKGIAILNTKLVEWKLFTTAVNEVLEGIPIADTIQ